MNDLVLRGPRPVLWLLVLAGVLTPLSARAAEPQADGTGPVVGRCVAPTRFLLARPAGGTSWRVLKPGDSVRAGELLVSLGHATIESANGAVRLDLLGDLAHAETSPVQEAAVTLQAAMGTDLDVTLDRGHVSVSNRKPSGPTTVRLRFQGQTWELGLTTPQSRVALELYGRWARGVPFAKEARPGHVPAASLTLVVSSGEADLRVGGQQFALAAPPGPAEFHWDNQDGAAAAPRRLAQLPAWAAAAGAEETRALQEALGRLQQVLDERAVGRALAQVIARGPSATDQEVAVHALAATDDLDGLLTALSQEGNSPVRQAAVLALRHWIGHSPGRDLQVYQALLEKSKYTPPQAETVLQLLHSFGDDALARPETYETLIAYLQHPRLPVRELARWHLYRLAPAGKDIAYDPAGPQAAREKAYREWKKLVPDGMLPPRSR